MTKMERLPASYSFSITPPRRFRLRMAVSEAAAKMIKNGSATGILKRLTA